MSYDLFFNTRPETSRIGHVAFQDYFRERAHYQVSELQAFYQDEDTGVYFSFDYRDEDAAEAGEDPPAYEASFNLNYYRPHVFGLEAEPEVTAFVSRFNLLIDDPQMEGMGRGAYSPAGFLRGWNAGNRVGYHAVLKSENKPDRVDFLAGDEIERCWRWNYRRAALQDKHDSMFVPRIMFLRDTGVRTFVVWSDAIPTVFPKVDLVILYRKELSQLKLNEGEADLALCTMQELLQLSLEFQRGPDDSLMLAYDEPPETALELFRKKKRHPEKLEGLSVDDVLNAEMVQEFQ
jgi:hypothetical protein